LFKTLSIKGIILIKDFCTSKAVRQQLYWNWTFCIYELCAK